MKMFKLAVGFAAGYVLGTRAGREKFEQIAAATRKASSHPTVVQAQEKAKALLATGQEKIAAKLPHDDTTTVTTPTVPATTTPRVPQPARTGGDPLL